MSQFPFTAHYFVDAQGKIRKTHFGEGNYEESERTIQNLLAEAQAKEIPSGLVSIRADGSQAPGLDEALKSPETYLGYARAAHQISVPPVQKDKAADYQLPTTLALNEWGLGGLWKITEEHAALVKASGKIVFRFHARDLHLVLGPGPDKTPISFVVRLDGKPLGVNHGADTDSSGRGIIKEQRLYQLIRQTDETNIQDRTFEIEFLVPGAQAFAFTFG